MKENVRIWLHVILKNWPTLLCFEILYKMIGFFLLENLVGWAESAVLRINGISFISQENLMLVLRSPRALLVLLCALLLFAGYVYFEVAAFVLYCETGWNNERLSIWALVKGTIPHVRNLLQPQNLPVLFLLFPIIGLSVFPLTYGFMRGLRIPEFILDYIQAAPALFAAFLGVMLLSNVLLFFCLFRLPGAVLHGEHLRGSLRPRTTPIRGHKRETALYLLLCFTGTALLLLAAFAGMVLFLWSWSKFPPVPSDGGKVLFQIYYTKWSAMGRVAANVLGTVALYAMVITLCHRYRGDMRPGPSRRAAGSILLRAAYVVIAVALLAVYSETEFVMDLYPAEFQTEIVAHRAGAMFAPENTAAALEGAIHAGADMAEIDVRQTSDGVLIVMHDSDFKRTAGLDQKVWETDYATVKTLDAGSFFSREFKGEKIPALADMLAAAKDRIQLMIELKADGHEQNYVENTLAEIKAAGMEKQCVIASMNLDLLRRSKELVPEIGTVYITTVLLAGPYDLNYVDAYSVEISFLTVETVAQIHQEGKRVYAWTANTQANMKKILRLEADGLVTDNPELAQFLLHYAGEDLLLNFLVERLYL